jgi:hypothetical protein
MLKLPATRPFAAAVYAKVISYGGPKSGKAAAHHIQL